MIATATSITIIGRATKNHCLKVAEVGEIKLKIALALALALSLSLSLVVLQPRALSLCLPSLLSLALVLSLRSKSAHSAIRDSRLGTTKLLTQEDRADSTRLA